MNTIQLTIQASEQEQEILISLFTELNATGFEQLEGSLLAYFPESDFNSYEVNEIIKGREHHIQVMEEQNWNSVWESNFSPVIVEDFCAVRADFHLPVKNVQFEIIITPKMSFGTGHHATTYMMMHQMREMNFKEKNVFDFGTGTGILAILAEKLGAAKIYGIDVDDWSIRNAEENIKNNNCNNIVVEQSSVLPDERFDIILANINRNVILQYMPSLKKTVVDKGYILFSGLLKEDAEIIISSANAELQLIKSEEKDNWLSLLFKSA